VTDYINKQKRLRGWRGCCGFVSVVNLMKWLGHALSYKEFVKGVPTEILEDGMSNSEMDALLKTSGTAGHKHTEYPTVKRIERLLNEGRAVILGYYWIDDDNKEGNYERPHFAFIHGHDKENLFIENKLHTPSKEAMSHFLTIARGRGCGGVVMYSFFK
jgi:hypothetical protein